MGSSSEIGSWWLCFWAFDRDEHLSRRCFQSIIVKECKGPIWWDDEVVGCPLGFDGLWWCLHVLAEDVRLLETYLLHWVKTRTRIRRIGSGRLSIVLTYSTLWCEAGTVCLVAWLTSILIRRTRYGIVRNYSIRTTCLWSKRRHDSATIIRFLYCFYVNSGMW